MWRLAAPVLALLLLGASFLRAGSELMVAACALMIAVLAIPRPWAARLAQLVLLFAAIRWLWLTWMLAGMRAAAGVPYLRMAAILGAVALLTVLAAWVFQSERLKRYYRLGAQAPPA